jgi:enamine deaminase RidA (YjgF/YER057c/UK114 family)
MNDVKRIDPGPRISGAVVHGETVYVAGTVAKDPSVGVRQQTEQILTRIDELLAKAGSNKSRLLSCTVWLADMRHYDEMNAAWDAWLDKANPPARATVEARLATPKYLVEIAAIAAR